MVNDICGALCCLLCGNDAVTQFHEDKRRNYVRCEACQLVFVPSQYWLSKDEEKAVYDLHENNPEDQGYRRFLSRLSEPLLVKLAEERHGLDFGCGPGPVLSQLFIEKGHCMSMFDPFYFNDVSLLDKNYDFVCSTEVVEHLYFPDKELTRLFSMVKPGGWLGLMTKMVTNQQAFSRWHYIQDLTHVCFYSRPTFEYIGERFNASVEFFGNDVILFHIN